MTPQDKPVGVAVTEKDVESGIEITTTSDEDVTVDITVKGIRNGYEDKEIAQPQEKQTEVESEE